MAAHLRHSPYCTARHLELLLVCALLAPTCPARGPLSFTPGPDGLSFWIQDGPAVWLESAGASYGSQPLAVSGPVAPIQGTDRLGRYSGSSRSLRGDGFSATVSIRLYSVSPGTTVAAMDLEFSRAHGMALPGPSAQRQVSAAFPAFKAPSNGGPALNAITYWGPSGMFTELTRLWSPGALSNNDTCVSTGNSKGCDGMGPLILYDRNLTTLVISPMSEFLSHQTALSASGDEIHSGLRATVDTVPAGYRLSTLLVAGTGLTSTVEEWGRLLRKFHGKSVPVSEALRENWARDPSLRYLSYWTDAGAAYYYQTEKSRNYEQTMQDVKAWMAANSIPTQVYQFDSWWYSQDKGRPGGPLIDWEPLPSVFPDGFNRSWFDTPNRSRSPLVMHNRAISPDCKYNKSWFVVEQDLALPQSEEFFTHIMAKAEVLGLKVYEQDWICLTHMRMNATQDNVVRARQWMLAMDSAATKMNMTIQLCMQYSRHVLQTLEMDSVTQARASTDYHPVPKIGCKFNQPNPTCTQYQIGLTSLFYAALGILPSKDNFKTSNRPQDGFSPTEPNPLLQTLVAGLSGGPVGPSDALGAMDFNSVHHICRGPDGFLNKPTKVATPLDLTFRLGFDLFEQGLDSLPFIQNAFSDLLGWRWHYLLAVDLPAPVSVSLSDLGLASGSSHVAFEYFPECWRNATAAELGLCEFEVGPGHTVVLNGSSPLVLKPGGVLGDNLGSHELATPFRYVVTAPTFPNGWTLLGEVGKFFTATHDRFSELKLGEDQWQVTVSGAPNEHVMIKLIPPGGMAGVIGSPVQIIAVKCMSLGNNGTAMLKCSGGGGAGVKTAANCTC